MNRLLEQTLLRQLTAWKPAYGGIEVSASVLYKRLSGFPILKTSLLSAWDLYGLKNESILGGNVEPILKAIQQVVGYRSDNLPYTCMSLTLVVLTRGSMLRIALIQVG